jgi:steroid delta-isomerase-like uncharacterized protein
MLDIIKKHVADFSASNWNDYKAAVAPDIIYVEAATSLRVQGVDDYLKANQKWKRAFPDAKGKVIGGSFSGDQVVAEIEWEGTQTGPLEGPMGTIGPTGRKARVDAVFVTTIRNGKIVELHHYFDMLTILTQLGVAPMMGAGAQAPGKGDGQPSQRRP